MYTIDTWAGILSFFPSLILPFPPAPRICTIIKIVRDRPALC
jgi:hypothetical protein